MRLRMWGTSRRWTILVKVTRKDGNYYVDINQAIIEIWCKKAGVYHCQTSSVVPENNHCRAQMSVMQILKTQVAYYRVTIRIPCLCNRPL